MVEIVSRSRMGRRGTVDLTGELDLSCRVQVETQAGKTRRRGRRSLSSTPAANQTNPTIYLNINVVGFLSTITNGREVVKY